MWLILGEGGTSFGVFVKVLCECVLWMWTARDSETFQLGRYDVCMPRQIDRRDRMMVQTPWILY